MTIDQVMLGAVRHYLMGMASAARLTHSEMKETGRSFDHVFSKDGKTLGESIDDAKQAFLRDCREMLKDPVPTQYAHLENYHLRPGDRNFINELNRMAESIDWKNPENVEGLVKKIDAYAPHGGFKSGL